MIDKTFMSSMHKRNIKLISFGKKNYYSHNIKSKNIIFNMNKILIVTFKYQSVCIFLNTFTKISFGKTFFVHKITKIPTNDHDLVHSELHSYFHGIQFNKCA